VSSKTAKQFCQDNGNMLFVETSAKSNMNVEQAFVRLAELALQRQEQMNKMADEKLRRERVQSSAQRLRNSSNR